MEKLSNSEAPSSEGTTPVTTTAPVNTPPVAAGRVSTSPVKTLDDELKSTSMENLSNIDAPASDGTETPEKVEGEVLVVKVFPDRRGGSVVGTGNSKICPHSNLKGYCANRLTCKFRHNYNEVEEHYMRSTKHSVTQSSAWRFHNYDESKSSIDPFKVKPAPVTNPTVVTKVVENDPDGGDRDGEEKTIVNEGVENDPDGGDLDGEEVILYKGRNFM